MKPVNLNDYLNKNNPWSERLLGLTEFQKKRDVDQIEREYNQDKYARLAAIHLDSMEAYRNLELEQAGLPVETARPVISIGDELFEVTVPEARKMYYDLIRSNVNKYKSDRICELGCGYGYNLTLFDGEVYGGEYSSNAVSIAKRLQLDVRNFNYYNESDYTFIRPSTTIFTSHSIEQIPDASIIIENLRKVRNNIRFVIHIEPTVLAERSTLLGMMRNRYMELNDYNFNLRDILRQSADIEILEFSSDVFGVVPLNSSNVLVWKFID
jgi:SAM-dependent methyltransferase